MTPAGADPFGTAELRGRVLRSWAASPARFRADANTEEDYALGGYRDRVVVELAQNAADAAVRAGVVGRLRLDLSGGVLTATNTGAPLDAAGVEALSTLRASAKRGDEGAVGRFGVGFAAVVAVSDEPSIVSCATGLGVAWSATGSRAEVAAVPELTDELERRGGHVPMLRLPYGIDPSGPGTVAEFTTTVRLPLRDADAEALIRRLLEQVGPAVPLALPALTEITVAVDGAERRLTVTRPEHDRAPSTGTAGPPEGFVVVPVTINGERWHTVECGGETAPELFADRPVEERSRPHWSVRWAIPDGHLPGDVPPVVHAPTPSDEPLGLPALLLASFPLAPDRRHVAPGPLTGFLVERAAEAYIELLRRLPPTPRLFELVPGPLPRGELDAKIRRAVAERLPETPLLPAADHPGGPGSDDGVRLRGRDAMVVDGVPDAASALADVLPGLLPSGWPARHPALAVLGVRRMGLADVVDALAGLDRDPAWWHGLYTALEGVDTEALAGLPVPLADGRTVRGPRGVLIAADGVDPGGLDALNLRFVHPEAVHRLLRRLGAVDAGPRAVLTADATRAAVAASYEEDDPEPIADAVLSLVVAAGTRPGEEPWLAGLALPGDDGEPYPAGELMFPDAPLRRVVAADAPFGVVDSRLVDRYGAEALEAVGVLRTFALLRAEDVTEPDFQLDGEREWAEELADRFGAELPPTVPELSAVRDLELVDDWPEALRLLAEPGLRAAVVEPVRVVLSNGRGASAPSYTAWWLRGHPVLGGRYPGELRVADGDPLLDGLYDPAPAGLAADVAAALGVRTSLAALLAEPDGADELLDRLADPRCSVPRSGLGRLWRALASVEPLEVEPPERVRALADGEPEVVPAADAIVVGRPDLLPLLAGQPLVLVPVDRAVSLAEALGLSLGGDEVAGVVESTGTSRRVSDAVRAVLPEAPESYRHHDALVVDGCRVSWWYDAGTVHASGPGGLARGLAWACGRWADRLLAEAAERDGATLPTLLAEADLNPSR